jgi:phosphate transport system substrate-binding protein
VIKMKNAAAVSVAIAALFAPQSWADIVKLHGATTVVNVVITPNREAVQKSTGHTLEIVGNATGRGLVDLAEGKADAAMVSEPLDIAVAAAEAAGKKIDVKTLQMHEIRKDEVMFVVHPSNAVGPLSWEQLADIHTGKITNWKQVGGKDAAIVVYSDALTGGTRALVKKVVMKDVDYAANVKSLTNVSRVSELVAQDANGVGAVGRGFVDAAKTKVVQTRKVERPLGLVTIGAPSAKVTQVVEAFRAEVAKGGK